MKKLLAVMVLLLAYSNIAVAESLRDTVGVAMDYYESGNYEDALPLFEKLLAEQSLFKGDKAGKELRYKFTYYAGYCANEQGDIEKAVKYVAGALSLAKSLKFDKQLPPIYTFMGELERKRGKYKDAIKYYNEALDGVDSTSFDAAILFYFIAESYRENGNYKNALSICERATLVSKEYGYKEVEIAVLTTVGKVQYGMNKHSEALRTLTSALNLAVEGQKTLDIAKIHLAFAHIYQAQGKEDLARHYYEDALRFYVLNSDTVEVPSVVASLTAMPPCSKLQATRAKEVYRTNAGNYKESGSDVVARTLQYLVAYYEAIAGDSDTAIRDHKRVFEDAIAAKDTKNISIIATGLSNMLTNTSFSDDERARYADVLDDFKKRLK
ncbi:hypothetical protein RsTz2092_03770 [Deferribacterales bacterium RsTz2092]|nr:hypothetical protein AGMMS49941_02430 [Deferribacterales bacterium]